MTLVGRGWRRRGVRAVRAPRASFAPATSRPRGSSATYEDGPLVGLDVRSTSRRRGRASSCARSSSTGGCRGSRRTAPGSISAVDSIGLELGLTWLQPQGGSFASTPGLRGRRWGSRCRSSLDATGPLARRSTAASGGATRLLALAASSRTRRRRARPTSSITARVAPGGLRAPRRRRAIARRAERRCAPPRSREREPRLLTGLSAAPSRRTVRQRAVVRPAAASRRASRRR